MLPVAEKLDAVGYHSLEVWGGATFDSCLRFLNEDPWERLRLLKAHLKKTPLQMLLRGQNIVGYRHYPDDVVERFVVKARENGIDIFRIFDALNDLRNMEWAMKVAKREGGHVQGTICYTISPVHSNDLFVEQARRLEEMGADSICIKDMAGLLAPRDAFDLVSKLKQQVRVPIQLHCHCTSGMATAAYLKAIEAGVDVVDTAISTLSLASSQPPTETVVSMLQHTPFDTGLDLTLLSQIARHFSEVRKKYQEFEGQLVGVDINVLVYQIPGGMISNLVNQLREQKALDKLDQVLAEVPRVRQELGYPPLVTPSSQIVGTQASLNVLLGERYKTVPKEVRAYVQGYYGKPPGEIDPQVRKVVLGEEETIQCRPADMLAPEMEKAAQESKGQARSEEDVLSYALFPQVALDFFQRRLSDGKVGKEVVAAIAAALAPTTAPASKVTKPVAPQRVAESPWKLAGRQQMMNTRGGFRS
jgi:oxaloacetate decarboxylase alpha subunit